MMTSMHNPQKYVIVGLSGGVDSAVCCRLLQRNGYTVTGLFLVMSDVHHESLPSAQKTAGELGIELITRDVSKEFYEEIIQYFMHAYADGITPNPCVYCNERVKFKKLLEIADEYEYPYISTGHYAKLSVIDGTYILSRADEIKKDQSYMLYRLDQDVLSRLILPLGSYTKSSIRSIAEEEGLSAFNAPDSQEICFIRDESYTEYMHRNNIKGLSGNFILPTGEILGVHKGTEYYTVGQRKGLNVCLGTPVYIKKILTSGDILLDTSSGIQISGIVAEDLFINPHFNIDESSEYSCKVRYSNNSSSVSVKKTETGYISL